MKVPFKIIIANHKRDLTAFREAAFYTEPLDKPEMAQLSEAFNNYFISKASDAREGTEQVRYLVVSAERQDYDAAVEFFNSLENSLRTMFRNLDASIHPMDAKERLESLHRIYRMGRESEFAFDFQTYVKNAKDFKAAFAPDYIKEYDDHLESDGLYHRTLYVRDFAFGSINDEFIKDITSAPYHTITTLDIVPVAKDNAIRFVQNKYDGVQRAIEKMRMSRVANNQIFSEIPAAIRRESGELETLYELLKDTDENLYFVGITIIITAGSLQELDNITESIRQIAGESNMHMEPHWLYQLDAFKTSLPIAGRYIRSSRTLNTDNLTRLVPFNAQDLMDTSGICYGVNLATKNLIYANRRTLMNQNGFIFGMSGSGKTYIASTEMEQMILKHPKDTLLVIDPKGEYKERILAIGGEYIDISLQSGHHINPLEYNALAATDPDAFISTKSDFMLSICDAACKDGISDVQRSAIDRCIHILYAELVLKKDVDYRTLPEVTMVDFYNILKTQSGNEAQKLAEIMEIFVTGSLNLFAHPTNVDMSNQMLGFGISGVGQNLWNIAMLIMIEFIRTKIKDNFKNGIFTWFYVDEFHELLGKDYTESYMEQFWKEMRSFGCGCTGMTQNIRDTLENKRTKNMLANSDFVLMLKQSDNDVDELAMLYGLSDAQADAITNVPPGHGLLKFGNKFLQFSFEMPGDSLIYKLNNSDPASK